MDVIMQPVLIAVDDQALNLGVHRQVAASTDNSLKVSDTAIR